MQKTNKERAKAMTENAGREYGVNAGLAFRSLNATRLLLPQPRDRNDIVLDYSPSADQLRPKPGKTMMAGARQGISVFACKV